MRSGDFFLRWRLQVGFLDKKKGSGPSVYSQWVGTFLYLYDNRTTRKVNLLRLDYLPYFIKQYSMVHLDKTWILLHNKDKSGN